MHIMANKNYRPTVLSDISHLTEALLLKSCIANCEYFIYQKDFGLEMGRHSERKSHIHAAAVALYRRVQKLLDFGKEDNFIELPSYFRPGHSHYGTVEVNVLATGQFWMKTRSDFQQACHSTLD